MKICILQDKDVKNDATKICNTNKIDGVMLEILQMMHKIGT